MRFYSFLIFILSLFAYYFSPMHYSYQYSVFLMILFIGNVFIITKDDLSKKLYLSFNILFSISFFLTTFAYPIFIKQIESFYVFGMSFANDNLITKSTALAQLAFSIFSISYVLFRKDEKKAVAKIYFPLKGFRRVTNILIFFVSLIFLYVFLQELGKNPSMINFEAGYVLSILSSVFFMTIITRVFYSNEKRTIKGFLIKDKFLYLSLFVIFLSFLSIGDRGYIIYFGVLLTSLFVVYYRRIKIVSFFMAAIAAIIILFFIGNLRKSEYYERSNFITGMKEGHENFDSYWIYFMDLISVNLNLYDGYEYSMHNELSYPGKIFFIPVSPIPFAPTLLANTFYDKPYRELSSGYTLNKFTGSKMSRELTWGLGTHCVSDVYISWGLIGIFMFFGLLGSSIGYSQSRIDYSIYAAIFYFTFTAFAIYIPRSTVYGSFDLVIKQWLIYYLVSQLLLKSIPQDE